MRSLLNARWRILRSVIERDLRAVSRSPGLVAPMIILSLLFSLLLPATAFHLSLSTDVPALESLVELLPDSATGQASSEASRGALALAIYVLPTLLVAVPIMVVTVIACDSIAGETERGTLEGLLLTPASDHELFLGKVLGALIPAVIIHLCCSTLYGILVNVMFADHVSGWALPTWNWLIIVLFIGPTFTTAVVGMTVAISARTTSVASANQISAITILPLLIAVIVQFGGVALLRGWLAVGVGVFLLTAAATMLKLGSRALNREKLMAAVR